MKAKPSFASTAFVALLRAVNVGGTGKLPMADLKRLCLAAGFGNPQTYIASGNVVFDAALREADVIAALEAQLARYAGKPVGVLVRTAAELVGILRRNPFPDAAPNRTVVIFLNERTTALSLDGLSGQKDERIEIGEREIYVHYGEGMADSRLKIPGARSGTARNINTVTRLAAMAGARGPTAPAERPQ